MKILKDIKEKLLSAIGPLFGLIAVLIFCFFSLKGCVITVWKSPDKPTAYEIVGDDKRALLMVFFPKNEVMIVAKNQFNKTEAILTRMRGVHGSHYFGNLWKVEGPNSGFFFGFKWVEEEVNPVHMEIEILSKFNPDNIDSSFGKVGTYHMTLYFKDKYVKYHGMWLGEVDIDKDQIESVRSSFFSKN